MRGNPKITAYIVGLAVMALFLVLHSQYGDHLSLRARIYLAILSVIASGLIWHWVFHRLADESPGARGPAREVSLEVESLPNALWLAAIPPLLVAAALWWVTAHGDGLPWRQSGGEAFRHSLSYRVLVGMTIFGNGLAAGMFVVALAVWYGMSRAYRFRRAQLLAAVANLWVVLLLTLGSAGGTAFLLSDSMQVLAFALTLVAVLLLLWNSFRIQRMYAANPRTGNWFYLDRYDPAFLGPRGLNLASSWCWIILAAFITPVLAAEWLLGRV